MYCFAIYTYTGERNSKNTMRIVYMSFKTPTTTKTKKKERIIKDTHRKRERSSKNVVEINNGDNKQKKNVTVCSLYSSVPSTTLRKLNFS